MTYLHRPEREAGLRALACITWQVLLCIAFALYFLVCGTPAARAEAHWFGAIFAIAAFGAWVISLPRPVQALWWLGAVSLVGSFAFLLGAFCGWW